MNLSDSSPLVSVVTPVYNGAKYLSECIESVLAQTYGNWEYVIVNNCSTDSTPEIACSYARRDSRIRVHNNSEFLSVIPNWNNALRQISQHSKYCKVVHADDCLFPECLEKMVRVAEEYPTVSIVGAYALKGHRIWLDGLPYPTTVIPGREICRQRLLGGPYVFGSPTSILMRADLVRQRPEFYNELNFHADNEVCYELLKNSDFGFIYQVLTYTREHPETGTTFALRYNTFQLAELAILLRYGAYYLTEEEYRRVLRYRIKRYYLFLGKSVLLRREKAFWEYHKKELQKIGYGLSVPRVIAACSTIALNNLLNPGDAIKGLIGRLQNHGASTE